VARRARARRPARRAARTKLAASDGRRPAIVSGVARRRAPAISGTAAGGSGGWASIASIGVASAVRPPNSPIVSEIAPAVRATPSSPEHRTGEPEKPGPRPVASTAGPETRTRIRALRGSVPMTSRISTANRDTCVPRTTVSPVQRAPGLTSASGMIGAAA
jgi:hypothetical protein